MSTDIVNFDGPSGGPTSRIFRLDALKLFLYISIPMMVVAFAAWAILYKLASRKASRKDQKARKREEND